MLCNKSLDLCAEKLSLLLNLMGFSFSISESANKSFVFGRNEAKVAYTYFFQQWSLVRHYPLRERVRPGVRAASSFKQQSGLLRAQIGSFCSYRPTGLLTATHGSPQVEVEAALSMIRIWTREEQTAIFSSWQLRDFHR